MTILGVAWGTFATVALLSFGAGLEREMARRAQGLGQGIMILWPGTTSRPYRGVPEGQDVRFFRRDAEVLQQQIPGLQAVTPESLRYEPVVRGDSVYRAMLAGVGAEYGELRSMTPVHGGRFLSQRDLDESRACAFLGDRIAEELFPSMDAVGQSVVIGGTRFLVVGVMEPKDQDSDYEGKDSDRVCVPITTFARRFGSDSVDNFVLRARDPAQTKLVMNSVTDVLAASKSFDAGDPAAIRWWDTTEGDNVRRYAFLAMDVLMGGAAFLTLLVGGLGASNLMFLRVRSRTSEIGLLLALGATPRRVLISVLGETFWLMVVGGLIGVGAALLAGWLVAHSALRDSVGTPEVSLALGGGTVLTLVVLGLIAGWFPARRAATVDPVLALGGRS
jgi:putative ABC transport system permease protein